MVKANWMRARRTASPASNISTPQISASALGATTNTGPRLQTGSEPSQKTPDRDRTQIPRTPEGRRDAGGRPIDFSGAGASERALIGSRSEEHTSELQSLMRISY